MLYTKNAPVVLKTVKFQLDKDTYVNVREMSSTDLLYYQENYKEDSGESKFTFACDMLSRSLVDDDGKLLFDSADDVATNFAVGASVFWALQQKIFDVSGLAKSEDAKKN